MPKKTKPILPFVDEEPYKPSSGKSSLLNIAVALVFILLGFAAALFFANRPL